MKYRAVIMKPEQPNETVEFDMGYNPSVNDLHRALDPILGTSNFEHVSVLADFSGGAKFKRADMFVDENGHAKDMWRNKNATAIYRRYAMKREMIKDPEQLPWIAGPAVLFERIVWR